MEKTLTQNTQPTTSLKPVVKNPNLTIQSGEMLLHDVIASEHVEVDFNHVKVNNVYYRTIFIA